MGLQPQPRLLWAIGIGAVLIALAGLNLVFAFLAALFNAGLAVLVIRDAARLPRRGYQMHRSVPVPFSLGEREQIGVVITNPRAAGLDAEVADHAPIGLGATPREVSGRFDENGHLSLTYITSSPRRGAYRFDRTDLRVARRGGWWRRQVKLQEGRDVAVYPSVLAVRRAQLSLRRGLRALSGSRRARVPGASTSFSGLRDYVPGDDIRRLSWTASARRDRPVTVEVESERGQQVMIALDCGRLMTAPAGHLSKLDRAINAALLLMWVCQQAGDRVGIMTFDDRVINYVKPERGAVQMSRVNQVLYRVEPEYIEPDFGHAFTHLAVRLGRRSLVVVLTDVLDAEASKDLVSHALRLANRHLVLVVAMSDPSVMSARDHAIDSAARAYEWAAAEELLTARRQAFDVLHSGGVLGLDVAGGQLSPALVERYLELKERALI
jgi:uncharacterized protein (DUF58 family)